MKQTKKMKQTNYTVESIRIDEESPLERIVVATVTADEITSTVWAVIGVMPQFKNQYKKATNGDLSWPLLSAYCCAVRFGASLDCWCPPVWQHDHRRLWDAIESRLLSMANVETPPASASPARN